MTQSNPDKWFSEALSSPISLDDDWVLWRAFCLRGTGFPLSMLDALVDVEPEEALTRVFDAEAHRKAQLESAVALCEAQIRLETENAKVWVRALRKLKRGFVPPRLGKLPNGSILLKQLQATEEGFTTAIAELNKALAAADERLHVQVRNAASDHRFQEAVAWQNRTFQQGAFSAYLASTDTGRKARRRRRNIVKYIQRYTTKNESIGFFGPFGWGSFAAGPLVCEAGPQLISKQSVYFEYWAIDTVVKGLSRDRDMLLNTAPYIAPNVRLDGDQLFTPYGQITVSPTQGEFLRACDGTRVASVLMDEFLNKPGAGLNSPDEFLMMLEQLREAETIVWRPPAPVQLRPEVALIEAINGIPDPSVVARLIQPLTVLEKAREAISTCTDSQERINALLRFDQVFENTIGRPAHHEKERVASGRSPVFEDCVRDFRLNLPDSLAEQIGPSLVMVMKSARWFGAQLTLQYREFVGGHFDALVEPGSELALTDLWVAIQQDRDVLKALVDDVVEQLQEHWQEIINVEDVSNAAPLVFSLDDIAAAVDEQFNVETPGWPGARFQSPDLMIAAKDCNAIESGNWTAILGEVHPLFNILTQETISATSPDEQAILKRAALERPERELVPVRARSGFGHRTRYVAAQANDISILFDDSGSFKSVSDTLRIADLSCYRDERGLRIRTRDDSQDFDALSFLAPQVRALAVGKFKMFKSRAYRPRIMIDRLVIARETWRQPFADLAFCRAKTRQQRYLEARRWARALKLPRWCFYQMPNVRKPWFVDFQSPVLVDLFTEQSTSAAEENPQAELSISEMLPNPEQAWLHDIDGQRYTSEFRLAVRDGGSAVGMT